MVMAFWGFMTEDGWSPCLPESLATSPEKKVQCLENRSSEHFRIEKDLWGRTSNPDLWFYRKATDGWWEWMICLTEQGSPITTPAGGGGHWTESSSSMYTIWGWAAGLHPAPCWPCSPSPNAQCRGHSEWLCKHKAVASGSGLQVVIPKEKGTLLIQVLEIRTPQFQVPILLLTVWPWAS